MQNLKQLFTNDDSAVSPVIGVILMVAITVILAAVIASFVLGLGDQGDPAPTPTIESDYSQDELLLSSTGGDDFTAADADLQFEVTIEGEDNSGNVYTADVSGTADLDDASSLSLTEEEAPSSGSLNTANAVSLSIDSSNDEFSAGDEISITPGTDAFNTASDGSGTDFDANAITSWEVEIVWNPADGESSTIYSDSSN